LAVHHVVQAYAKLFGNYSELVSGEGSTAFLHLTAGVPHSLEFSSLTPAAIFHSAQRFLAAGDVMIASANANGQKQLSGLAYRHAYSVLGAFSVVDEGGVSHQLLQLRDPHARDEWTGEWSDRSVRWTTLTRAQVPGWKDQLDGVFFMPVQDFVKHFWRFFRVRFVPVYWNEYRINAVWPQGSTNCRIAVRFKASSLLLKRLPPSVKQSSHDTGSTSRGSSLDQATPLKITARWQLQQSLNQPFFSRDASSMQQPSSQPVTGAPSAASSEDRAPAVIDGTRTSLRASVEQIPPPMALSGSPAGGYPAPDGSLISTSPLNVHTSPPTVTLLIRVFLFTRHVNLKRTVAPVRFSVRVTDHTGAVVGDLGQRKLNFLAEHFHAWYEVTLPLLELPGSSEDAAAATAAGGRTCRRYAPYYVVPYTLTPAPVDVEFAVIVASAAELVVRNADDQDATSVTRDSAKPSFRNFSEVPVGADRPSVLTAVEAAPAHVTSAPSAVAPARSAVTTTVAAQALLSSLGHHSSGGDHQRLHHVHEHMLSQSGHALAGSAYHNQIHRTSSGRVGADRVRKGFTSVAGIIRARL